MDEFLRVLAAVGALGLAGAIGGIIGARIQRGGAERAAQIAKEGAIAVAEINRDAQRLLAADASRREWRKELTQPLITQWEERRNLCIKVLAAVRGDNLERVHELAATFRAGDFAFRVSALGDVVPIELGRWMSLLLLTNAPASGWLTRRRATLA